MLMEWVLFGAGALVVYHHLAYPIILRRLAEAKRRQHAAAPEEAATPTPLPSLAIIVPAYQEAAYIVRKIDNLAAIEYPRDRLKIVIGCDGCTEYVHHIRLTMRALNGLDPTTEDRNSTTSTD